MKKKQFKSFIAAGLIAIFFASCGDSSASNPPAILKDANGMDPQPPISYGEGVYYFPGSGEKLAASLALFRKTDTTLKVKVIAVHTGTNGNELGAIVIMEK